MFAPKSALWASFTPSDLIPCRWHALGMFAAVVAFAAPRAAGQAPVLELVSKTSGGAAGNGQSGDLIVSRNGRYLYFESRATDLTGDADPNGAEVDVFSLDRLTGELSLVSKSIGGGAGDARSRISNEAPSQRCVSADGRFLAFKSEASDLTVDSDLNGEDDIFLFDREAGTSRLVSRSMTGGASNGDCDSWLSISEDGRYLVFSSDATDMTAEADQNDREDLFFYDRDTQALTLISKSVSGSAGDDSSWSPHTSADGRHVYFNSYATDLTPEPDGNDERDVFLWDRLTEEITLVSRTPGGTTGDGQSYVTSCSAEGRYCVISSWASDLTPHDDQNGQFDLFLYDRVLDSISLISRSTSGDSANASSSHGILSPDGRFIAFRSTATDLVTDTDLNGLPDAFLFDREQDTIRLVTKGLGGGAGNSSSDIHWLSGDGGVLIITSSASDLTTDLDTDGGARDLFTYERLSDTVTLLSPAAGGGSGNAPCEFPRVSADGRLVSFQSAGTDLVSSEDTNGMNDVFLVDRFGDQIGSAYCFCDGVVVSAPCGNDGASGSGCANGTFAEGAELHATGAASVSADSVVLEVQRTVPGGPGMFFQGDNTTANGLGQAFGDGLRCAGGSVARLEVTIASGAGAATSSVSLATRGEASPGDTKRYQYWYRDPAGSPCGGMFNLTNGLEILWLP